MCRFKTISFKEIKKFPDFYIYGNGNFAKSIISLCKYYNLKTPSGVLGLCELDGIDGLEFFNIQRIKNKNIPIIVGSKDYENEVIVKLNMHSFFNVYTLILDDVFFELVIKLNELNCSSVNFLDPICLNDSIYVNKCLFQTFPYLKYLFARCNPSSDITDSNIKYIVIFGYKFHAQIMDAIYAIQNSIPVLWLEDGFLRSADTASNRFADRKFTAGISFTLSKLRTHFDSLGPSSVEMILNSADIVLTKSQINFARYCIDFIIQNNLSKYNHQSIYNPTIGRTGVDKILVVDQSYNDCSIVMGGANNSTFEFMLRTAIAENPNADIIVKTHPDSVAPGTVRSQRYFESDLACKNVYIYDQPINPISLINYCSKVYVCTSQFGFEALMCNKEVHVFGVPFYAGWGLTSDYNKCPRRKLKRSLEELFYIIYVMNSYYVDPKSERSCDILTAMDYLLELRTEYLVQNYLHQ